MSDQASNFASDNVNLPIQQLPKTALQAIYHAVTGKTENYSKSLRKNVIVTHSSVEQLYNLVRQQAEHYSLVTAPTVTVITKNEDSKTLQYSSWERFKFFQTNTSDITSELVFKFEFLIQIPNTVSPQRFTLNVVIDSGLPLLSNRGTEFEDDMLFDFFFTPGNYRTVSISIDFVDFLIAKIFANVIEEWFETLAIVPKPKWSNLLHKKARLFQSIINQFGRLGTAIFLSTYAFFHKSAYVNILDLAYACSIAIVVWAIVAVVLEGSRSKLGRAMMRSVLPSVLLLTEGDSKAFETAKHNVEKSHLSVIRSIGACSFSIILNVISSYLYSYIH